MDAHAARAPWRHLLCRRRAATRVCRGVGRAGMPAAADRRDEVRRGGGGLPSACASFRPCTRSRPTAIRSTTQLPRGSQPTPRSPPPPPPPPPPQRHPRCAALWLAAARGKRDQRGAGGAPGGRRPGGGAGLAAREHAARAVCVCVWGGGGCRQLWARTDTAARTPAATPPTHPHEPPLHPHPLSHTPMRSWPLPFWTSSPPSPSPPTRRCGATRACASSRTSPP